MPSSVLLGTIKKSAQKGAHAVDGEIGHGLVGRKEVLGGAP